MKYRKKPVVVEAVRYDGTNAAEITQTFCPPLLQRMSGEVLIDTLEGDMLVSVGDYIIRGVRGEFYPCKPNIFEATYEPAEEE